MAAPEGNKNAEKWTLQEAEKLFADLLEISQDKDNDGNDFIGEVAQQKKVSIFTLDYLKEKFPQLQSDYNEIKSNCESNCFANGKKGNIVPSLAIMNLKSNHGWTDRVDQTTKGEKLPAPPIQWNGTDK